MDDSFLQPEPGLSAADHVGALVPLALVVGAAAVYPRLRAGARAALALAFGVFGIAYGIEAVYYTLNGGPSGDDFTGWLSLVAGLVLVGLGIVTLWRTRRTDDRGGGATSGAPCSRSPPSSSRLDSFPLVLAQVITHTSRAHVPDARPRRRPRRRVVHDVRRPPARGVVRAVAKRRDRDRRPGRSGPQKQTRMLVRNGYGVLLFDRRGEGASDGDPNIFGWGGERDLHAAAAYLQSRPDVDPERIGAIGLSVGGEMLIHAAAHPMRSRPSSRRERAASRSATSSTNPGLSDRLLDFPTQVVLTSRDAFSRTNFLPEPESEVAKISPTPVLFVYGEHGQGGAETVPNQGFYAAAREPKGIWEVPNGQHVAGITTEPEEYERRVMGFLDEALLGN